MARRIIDRVSYWVGLMDWEQRGLIVLNLITFSWLGWIIYLTYETYTWRMP